MTEAFRIVDPSVVDSEPFPESGIHHRKLTDILGATEMRITMVELEPGEATAPHAHERQEEIYLTTTGGTFEVDGETHPVPPGGIVRFGPTSIRSVRNDGTTTERWLMFGAPPVGTVDDFGEYVMPDDI